MMTPTVVALGLTTPMARLHAQLDDTYDYGAPMQTTKEVVPGYDACCKLTF
jgi:hypothetical protein